MTTDTPAPRVVVFAEQPSDVRRSGRTLRALTARGHAPLDATQDRASRLAARIGGGPVWLVRAGCLPIDPGPRTFPPPSATGKPLAALGAIGPAPDGASDDRCLAWDQLLARSGGDLSGFGHTLPPVASVYLGARTSSELAQRLASDTPLPAALAMVLAGDVRLVRYAALDVYDDPRLRVVLAVTSLQQGGAERMVLDLHAELGAHGIAPVLAVLGRPTRAAFPTPPGALDLSCAPARIEALAKAAIELGADAVHAHLLDADETAQLAAASVPVAISIHNTRPGWPEGLERLTERHASLLLPCSLAAQADLVEAAIPIPCRTVWNGIDATRFAPGPTLRAQGEAFRRAHGIAPHAFVLLAVANPRPQKRLHLLPAVLDQVPAALRQRGIDRPAHLVIAGHADPRAQAAARSAAELRAAIEAHGLVRRVHLLDSQDVVAPLMAGADVLVSTSAHEGLSLAHLEALAVGLPVVATAAGGTTELAPGNPAIRVLPLDAAPRALAHAAVDLGLARPDGGRARVLAGFTRTHMAARTAMFYRRMVAPGPAPGGGIVLVTNNFSTGGAQSSARRLLVGLAREGIRCRAIVLEEQSGHPTPGRRALEAAGVPVSAAPTAGTMPPSAVVDHVLADLDDEPPEAVLFWNALAEIKIRLADALLEVPVFDVSPGEMYFRSLERAIPRLSPELPYRDARAYGARLRGVVVKYRAEAAWAAETLGAPVHVVPNGVDLGPLPIRVPGDRLIIGTAARLSPQKKLEDLLAALRLAAPRLPPHTLLVAGGPERGSEAYAHELQQSSRGLSIEWLGELADASAWLSRLDLFAMISEPAGCPNASLEAMAAGLPVIATDVGGASEQVVDGVTGRLVPRGDVASFAASLVELGADRDRRMAMGQAGRTRAEVRFDARRMVADYRRICLGR